MLTDDMRKDYLLYAAFFGILALRFGLNLDTVSHVTVGMAIGSCLAYGLGR